MKIQLSILTTLICFSSPIYALPLTDTDGDLLPDTIDNCTLIANSDQQDNDFDGYGDRCDGDFNNNGTVDSSDEDYFLFMYNNTFGFFQEADFNSDGIVNSEDLALFSGFIGLPPGPSQIGDLDRDGTLDPLDNCRLVVNTNQADFDINGVGDVCDDQDGDTIFDATDNCLFVRNIEQTDGDNDGYGNICDGDLNNDGVVDNQDKNLLVNLIGTSDPNADINGDGFIDTSDQVLIEALIDLPAGPSLTGDIDYDGVYDADDNCLTMENTNQMNLDGDNLGAACDPDEFFVTAGKETQINDYTNQTQQAPAIAKDKNNNYVVVWEGRGIGSLYDDIYARRYNALGEPLGNSFKVNTSDEGYQSGASIDMDDNGNFVIVWRDTSSNIFAQRFNSLGERSGSEIQVSETSVRSTTGPAIAINESGGFWVVWDRDVSTDWEIYARSFSSDGSALGNEFKVNISARGYTPSVWAHGQAPAISYSPLTGYVIAWRSNNIDRTRDLIYLQQYTVNGETVGGEFLVDPSGNDAIGYPSIVHNNVGGFTVAWSGAGIDDNDGIYARMFNELGLPLANEFTVNTYRPEHQRHPTIASNATGNFVIVWQSWNQNEAWDVFAQRYNSMGQPMGGEFQVNGFTDSWQHQPVIVMNDSNDFVVAWSDAVQDGSYSGVFSQHFGTDTDKDEALDSFDNCTEAANSDQRDTNGDGFGNICDADLDNSGTVNLSDFSSFRSAFGGAVPLTQAQEDADFNGDDNVNLSDFSIFRSLFGKAPGPSCCTP